MRKTLRFAAITIWIIFSRAYDAYCTYQHTPDLSKEANPLVSVLGLTWTPLLMVITILSLYAIYAYYRTVFSPMNLLPVEKGLSFREVSTFVYLGKSDHWVSLLYKYPKSISHLNQVIGHTLAKCLVFAGVVSTIMWMLINHTEFYLQYHSAPLIYGILVAGCIIIIYRWFATMYKHYLEQDLMGNLVSSDLPIGD